MKKIHKQLITASVASVLLSATAPVAIAMETPEAAASVTAIKAGVIHVGDGETIRDGVVLIRDGEIVAVGKDLAIPEGATIHSFPEGSVTPGLIDANALLEPGDLVSQPTSRRRAAVFGFLQEGTQKWGKPGHNVNVCHDEIVDSCVLAESHDLLADGAICPVCGIEAHDHAADQYVSGVAGRPTAVETASEVVPNTFMIDSINFDSPDFQRLVREGVTTVYATPDSTAVIGPRGTIIDTAGPIGERVVREADAVHATVASDAYRSGWNNTTPSRFRGVTQRTRRPNSRMGLAWVLRKAFYDASAYEQGQHVAGPDQASSDALRVINQVRSGDIPLRVLARTHRDISTAFRIADEFGLSFTLLEGTEAYRNIDDLKSSGTSVIYGPIYMDASGARARTGETEHAKLVTLKALLDAGIPTALSAQDLREEDGLARQAMYAMRAGVTREQALEAVTHTPAKMLGIDEQVGTVADGKRANIVVWNGAPFDATSKPVLVLVNGNIEFEDK